MVAIDPLVSRDIHVWKCEHTDGHTDRPRLDRYTISSQGHEPYVSGLAKNAGRWLDNLIKVKNSQTKISVEL